MHLQDSRFLSSSYVDDFQIGDRHSDLTVIKGKLQQCLNNIENWTKNNRFKFSLAETKLMHFTALTGIHNSPELKLRDQVTWDPKLTWKEHICQLKADCKKLVGMLRAVTGQEWGGDQDSTLKIFRAFIRAKLDYGVPLYSSAAKSTLNALDFITTESFRIATGAFKTTPMDTLHVLANEMKPQHRRDYLALRYYYKIKSQISSPAYSRSVTALFLEIKEFHSRLV